MTWKKLHFLLSVKPENEPIDLPSFPLHRPLWKPAIQVHVAMESLRWVLKQWIRTEFLNKEKKLNFRKKL